MTKDISFDETRFFYQLSSESRHESDKKRIEVPIPIPEVRISEHEGTSTDLGDQGNKLDVNLQNHHSTNINKFPKSYVRKKKKQEMTTSQSQTLDEETISSEGPRGGLISRRDGKKIYLSLKKRLWSMYKTSPICNI